jgi:hypothetical protein
VGSLFFNDIQRNDYLMPFICSYLIFFSACPKKKQKRTPQNDIQPVLWGFPGWAFVLL